MNNFIIITFILALAIDFIIGELPARIHPVVMMGSIINFLKNKLKFNSKLTGFVITVLTITITSLIVIIILLIASFNNWLLLFVYSVILSSTFSFKMLLQTALNVKKNLDEDIKKARESVSYLVSRETQELEEDLIVSATIESMTENITDSFIAPVFYMAVFALLLKNHYIIILLIPLIYRVSNTLDAMLGYKTEELINIGFIPAKLDDVLNYIPSRISGVFVILSSFLLRYDFKNAFKILKRDSRNCPSPNSGFTMAPVAGALNIQLIKKDTYILGDNNKQINRNDIIKSVKLTCLSMITFTICVLIIMVIV